MNQLYYLNDMLFIVWNIPKIINNHGKSGKQNSNFMNRKFDYMCLKYICA